jgi:recombination protein RecR
MNLPSKLLDDAVQAFAQLPGIGQKSALRMVLHLLKVPAEQPERLVNCSCVFAGNCSIAQIVIMFPVQVSATPRRDQSTVCVVEDIRDVIAVENTAQFKGVYHVLGGLISPMDGVGPAQLQVDTLMEKASSGNVNEIIMALSTTMEGDTTLFYLYKKLKPSEIRISTLARGVAIGGALEYADELTLGRSILNRVPYENQLVK